MASQCFKKRLFADLRSPVNVDLTVDIGLAQLKLPDTKALEFLAEVKVHFRGLMHIQCDTMKVIESLLHHPSPITLSHSNFPDQRILVLL